MCSSKNIVHFRNGVNRAVNFYSREKQVRCCRSEYTYFRSSVPKPCTSVTEQNATFPPPLWLCSAVQQSHNCKQNEKTFRHSTRKLPLREQCCFFSPPYYSITAVDSRVYAVVKFHLINILGPRHSFLFHSLLTPTSIVL